MKFVEVSVQRVPGLMFKLTQNNDARVPKMCSIEKYTKEINRNSLFCPQM